MANNIKLIGNIIDTNTISRYDEKDSNLIVSRQLQEYFGGENDYIEYYIYDIGENLLYFDFEYLNYKSSPSTGLNPAVNILPNTTGNIQANNTVSSYSPTSGSLISVIEIDPIKDLQDLGYSSGEFAPKYYFFQNKLSNPIDKALFVKEISADRTEIRLASTTLTDDEIESVVNEMINEMNNSTYYVDYLLNFGDDRQYLTVNIALNRIIEGYEILFKLYKPLPTEIQEKDTLWIVSEKINPYSFEINLDKLVIPPPPPTLRGPNFDIPIYNTGTVSTTYLNYTTAVNRLQSLQSSSYYQLLNLLNTQSIQINVNYKVSESADFGNFVFFGSAESRLNNFYTKIKQIEDYTTLINQYKPYTSTTSSLQSEINLYSSSINTLISQFDGYEAYLYFESSSYAWPKSGSLKPFQLLSTSSISTLTWYNSQLILAQEYDANNYNKLIFSVPNFIVDNEENQPYLTFLNMVGQYFDNIWIYLKAITDINLANNNLNYGISKDLVYEQLKSLGIKIYNSQAGEALNSFLIGANTGSSLWNNDFSPTSSYLNNIPRKDLVSELYKRIYHNLPLLLKTKGTVTGLDHLMTIFGVPNRTYYVITSGSISSSFYTPTGSNFTSSILNVKEYGGSLKTNLIKGYNSDKVRIVSNELVTGSILSPIASLQTYPTASSQFRDSDLHFIDTSFSPQSQINTYISKSISSSNATWSLDDFIGDPRYAYSSSYDLLNIEKTKYYQVGVTGYAPFTASALDYNGFIRLIEFFDNSLFKMLGDFVPERTSLSTGVTFESPVLERNKAPYAIPSAYTGSVYEGEIDTVSISSDYGDFYDALGSDKKAWYDGDITGSYIDIYDYFENSNPNPYLQADSSSFTTQSIYEFLHSDFNVLFNNVSKSVDSLSRKKIEYIWGTTGSILTTPELQDSYLALKSYNTSRYDGSKTYGLKYNTYSSASFIIDSSITDVDYTFISSSFLWDAISSLTGNPYYTTLYITGSTNQLAEIITKFTIPEIEYIKFSNTNPVLPNVVIDTFYKVYRIDYYTSGFPITYDYTKLALALSPALKISNDGGMTYINTGEQPTINSDYGPGNLNLDFYKYYTGDYSYGKTTSIDRNSYKLGWVRTVQSESLNFNEKTTFDLKYLIDPNLQITELSANNNNLFEVQNIFKSGKTIQVSVTNKNFPSDQTKLDGTKTIFKGGYRYDPILFRENNEDLIFVYDSAYTQSIAYTGMKANSNYWYRYYSKDESIISDYLAMAEPSRYPYDGLFYNSIKYEAYKYWSNDDKINTELPMAQASIDQTTWSSSYSGTSGSGTPKNGSNNKINFQTAGTIPFRSASPGWVYLFNFINFNNIIDNTDNTTYDAKSKTEYFYKVPQTSNNYSINFNIPFYFESQDAPAVGKAAFKPVVIIESAATLDGPRSIVGVTTLTASFQEATPYAYDTTPASINSNPTFNTIIYENGDNAISYVKGFYNLNYSANNLSLNGGDYLIATFCIVDISDLFGHNNANNGSRYFNFILGGEGSINGINYTDDIKSSFEIRNNDNSYDVFYYTSSFTSLQGKMFETASANSIYGLPSLTKFIENPSIFTPTSDTKKYYTKVVDHFDIQKYDLFRFGAFKDSYPNYYTVTEVNPGFVSYTLNSVTFGFTNRYGRALHYISYPTTDPTPVTTFPAGVSIIITGTGEPTIDGTTQTIYSNASFGGNNYIYFLPIFPDPPPSSTSVTLSFPDKKYRIFFDKDLTETSNVNFSNFAILRPKPDETSIIIDYQKDLGDVSQTLLIPEDANQLLQNKTGDIFEYYNPRLNPSTQNQQN